MRYRRKRRKNKRRKTKFKKYIRVKRGGYRL
jgi:mRNA-degrading endonuclease RelE of RelBE toxin-antitoxin system